MKKTILILSIITLILAGCKKFDIIEASKMEIIKENIEKGNDYIKINVEYDYLVELEAVTLYLSEKEDMSGAESYDCNVEGKTFSVEVEGLKGGIDYYCSYEYYNGYHTNKCEVKSITRSMYLYYGHEYVDLGLPSGVKWATCNVGATSPEAYGDYFAWGETTTKSEYTEENSATYGLSISELQSQGYIDGAGNLNPQYDAARANWGGDWRMPTDAEQEELLNNCTWTWTTQNGVNGYKVSSKVNSNYIFLPAAGFRGGSSLGSAGSDGYYWSSTPYESGSYYAYYLRFYSDSHRMRYISRRSGRSVRPVLE